MRSVDLQTVSSANSNCCIDVGSGIFDKYRPARIDWQSSFVAKVYRNYENVARVGE